MIGAVLVNWNQADATLDAVRSLHAGTVRPDLVVVVDNGSRADDLARLEQARTEGLEVLARSGNDGYAIAINDGIDALVEAGVDLLFVLNNDATVAPDCLELLRDHVAIRPGLAVPTIVEPDGTVWFAGGRIKRRTGQVIHHQLGRPEGSVAGLGGPTQFATGCAFAADVATWRRLGGYRRDLFLYWEDVDLTLRALDSGVSIDWVPAARVVHDSGLSSRAAAGAGRARRSARSATTQYYEARNRFAVLAPRGIVARAELLVFGLLQAGRRAGRHVLAGGSAADYRATWTGLRDGFAGDFSETGPLTSAAGR